MNEQARLTARLWMFEEGRRSGWQGWSALCCCMGPQLPLDCSLPSITHSDISEFSFFVSFLVHGS